MITLYTAEGCEKCSAAARRLSDAHLAHRVEPAGQANAPGHSLRDGDGLTTGHPDVERRVEEYADLLRRTRRYQGDVCFDYGDEEP